MQQLGIGYSNRIAAFLILLFPAVTDVLQAGTNVWTSLGPEGGAIRALVIEPQNPAIVYAGASSGVFRSTDGGANWSAANSGLPNSAVSTLAVDAQRAGTVYALVESDGIFKTTDWAATWTAVNCGLPLEHNSIDSLVVDPRNTEIVYAGTFPGVFKSTDGGQSWMAANVGLRSRVGALAIDPGDSGIVFAALGFGLFKTTDGGMTWVATGFTADITALAIDPRNTATLYASATDPGGGLFKSLDGGESWTPLKSGLIARMLIVDPQDPSTIYALASISTANTLITPADISGAPAPS
jgi:photosystem II stability/assembly factor-like uncharacterized protein